VLPGETIIPDAHSEGELRDGVLVECETDKGKKGIGPGVPAYVFYVYGVPLKSILDG
jgi:hypothetical protein